MSQSSSAAALTAPTLCLTWLPHSTAGITCVAHPLLLTIIGQTAILTDDESFLLDLAQTSNHASTPPHRPPPPASITQPPRPPSPATVDGLHQPGASTTSTAEPAFFSGNIQSLSSAFSAITEEHVVTLRDDAIIRQTVAYSLRKWPRQKFSLRIHVTIAQTSSAAATLPKTSIASSRLYLRTTAESGPEGVADVGSSSYPLSRLCVVPCRFSGCLRFSSKHTPARIDRGVENASAPLAFAARI
jgi:hypothetical protein